MRAPPEISARMQSRGCAYSLPRPTRTFIVKNIVLTVACKSTRGIVAAISGYLADKGCNIVDSSQFDDLDTGMFFMRISFISEAGA